MRKAIVPVLAFLALAAVVGFIATSGGTGAPKSAEGGGGTAGDAATRAEAVGLPADAPAAEGLADMGGGLSLKGVGDLPAFGPSIVKTARVSLRVVKDGFEDAFSAAADVAGRYGGYVESSSQGGTRARFGELVIRIPNERFDEAMADLRALGEVEGQEFSAQDVSSQFVDLEARLRTWIAQETVLLKLMREANSVSSTLQIQRELQEVQFRIEQIKGQLRLLENQTDFATIHVGVREAGAPPRIEQQVPGEERPSLVEAWNKALNGALGVLYATVVGLGYLIPIAALAALAWFGFRRARPATS